MREGISQVEKSRHGKAKLFVVAELMKCLRWAPGSPWSLYAVNAHKKDLCILWR